MSQCVVTRREVLRLSASAGVSCMFGKVLEGGQRLIPAHSAVDHLLLGVADLERGIAWVESRTGVRAVWGGSHPGRGTRNALISLGGKRYLEIIAPDPAQQVYDFQIDLRTLTEPRLITWAAATTDINFVAKRAGEAGYQVFGPRDGSRARPDGKVLKWKSLGVAHQYSSQGIDPIPFFIEWDRDSLHPSEDSPKGCELDTFEIEHPVPLGLSSMLGKLGIEAKVRLGKEPRLVAMLKTPKGRGSIQ
jgi:Glyoxalase-like domain